MNGDCCLVRHAQATPPWTCDCECHTVKPEPAPDRVAQMKELLSKLGDGQPLCDPTFGDVCEPCAKIFEQFYEMVR